MRILLSGSTGLVGSELKNFLTGNGHQIINLIRYKDSENTTNIYWNYENNKIDFKRIENVDCVIHLAGENISAKRWSEKQKKKILDSRIQSTNFLIETLIRLEKKPHTFICASAIGYYGNRGNEILSETSNKGNSFLSNVCDEWEKSTSKAKESGIRAVNLRFGVILSEKGGALKKMIIPFKFGLGGKIGSGNQFVSWISLEDTIKAIDFCMHKKHINGPVNIVAPNPVTNYELTKLLGEYLNRSTMFPLPAFVAKMVLGEMANELLLASTRVEPNVLLENKFEFKYNKLNDLFKFGNK